MGKDKTKRLNLKNTRFLQKMRFLIVLVFFICSSFIRYSSQSGQDIFVYYEFFKDKKNGTFVDIGAYDGKYFSNTYFFEKQLGWNGICIEPINEIFQRLKKNRDCICVNGAITKQKKGKIPFLQIQGPETAIMLSGIASNYGPQMQKMIDEEIKTRNLTFKEISVQSYSINEVLQKYKFHKIDLLSIDVEGSEYEILESWNFKKHPVEVIVVENIFEDPKISSLLSSQGFEHIARIRHDDVYKFSEGAKTP